MARFSKALNPVLRPGLCLALAVCLLAAVPAQAGSRKARKLFNTGRQAELTKDYDKALEFYEQALFEDPDEKRYQLAVYRLRFVAGQAHVDRGRLLRQQSQLEEALAEFQRALEIDPASAVAAQERQRTLDLIEERNKSEDPDAAVDTASPLEREREARNKKVSAITTVPELKPFSTRPINVVISNQDSQVAFETIGKMAGINVLFDSEYQDKKISLDLNRATLYEALDYVSLQAKAYWKPVTDNAIFVTNDTPNKRRDYEEEVVKTFYLTNATTPQEIQEILQAVRSVTDLRRIFPVNALNAVVVRGSADKIALAEKIINDVDKARAEVIVDVLVLETSKSATRDLGISPVSGGANGISFPVTFTGEGVGATDGGVPLSELGGLSSRDWSTVLPDGIIQALMTRSDTRLLQAPRVRAADTMQATVNIGERFPIATGSFQPGIGGVGVNPLVNTQFQYIDVGVNVSLTPKIHSDSEVTMHVEIEISNVRDFVEIGGITQPVIGQRKVAHDIRIQEGNSSILGGLLQSQTFITRAGVPLLGDIPFLGRLFSTENVQDNENEILLVLIPHIVRQPEIRYANLKSVASGTDQIFRVRYEHEANDKPALPPLAADQPPEAEKPGEVAEAAPATPAEPVESPVPAGPAPQPAPAEPPAAAPAAPEQPAATTPVLAIDPPNPTVGIGQQVAVTVLVQNVTQLFGVPLRFGYDPKILRLTEITRGPFLAGEGTDLIFSRNIRNEVGQAAVNISRFPGTGGVEGSGVLVNLVLEGVAAGTSTLRVAPLGARDAQMKPINISSAQVTVSVQ